MTRGEAWLVHASTLLVGGTGLVPKTHVPGTQRLKHELLGRIEEHIHRVHPCHRRQDRRLGGANQVAEIDEPSTDHAGNR